MLGYLIRRVTLSIVVLLGIAAVTFLMISIVSRVRRTGRSREGATRRLTALSPAPPSKAVGIKPE